MTEDLAHADGSTRERVWTLTKAGAGNWTGTARGVIGTAAGVERGDRFLKARATRLPIPSAHGR